MSRSGPRRLAAIVWLVLAAVGGTAWAQSPEQSVNVTGRILFGWADLTQGPLSVSGPSTTLEGDVNGYWRDPRILEYDVKPFTTLGEAVPGTETGTAVTGGSATGLFLQGGSIPLTLTFARTSSRLGEEYKSDAPTNPNQDVLNGVEGSATNTLFDARQMLRFANWPVATFEYRDADYNFPLPQAFGGQDDIHSHDFTTHVNYNVAGWLLAGRYLHSQFATTAPDILTGTELTDKGATSDLGFSASRLLPLHSTLSVTEDQTKSDYHFDDLKTDLNVKTANAILTSEPVERLSTTVQTAYTSNLKASEVQQALAGAGVPGSGSASSGSTAPLTYLAAPYDVLSVGGGALFRIGHGFSLQGSVGDSRSSQNSETSKQWSAGVSYNHKWSSGWLSTGYSHGQSSTEAEVLNESATAGTGTSPGTTAYSLFSQHTDLNTVTGNLNQRLPKLLRLTTQGHVSEGTLTEYGSPYPYHDYGELTSLTRPVGEWTLSGNFGLEQIATNAPGTYNRSSSKSLVFSAAFRGLNLSGGYLYGSGFAQQVGNSLVFFPTPQPVSPVLGIPVLSSTSGTTVLGTYHSRRGRWTAMGFWYRFSYTTDDVPASHYNLFNFRTSYKLRRLRLIAGFVRQSQAMGTGVSDIFASRLMYFQIERVFRLY